jgi:acyl-CoA synthetase (AMP-forming)/AMP-acid ligase II
MMPVSGLLGADIQSGQMACDWRYVYQPIQNLSVEFTDIFIVLIKLQIVDSENCTELIDGKVGEVWVRSPSCAAGYWGLPEKSAEDFNGQLKGANSGEER